MNKVIYVPSINIEQEQWLISSFFLWEKLYRIVPFGCQPERHKRSGFERQLTGHGVDFIRNIHCSDIIPSALPMYQSLMEQILLNELPDTVFAKDLLARYPKGALIYDGKTDPALKALWQHHGIIQRKTPKGYLIPQFWADLWLVVLALHIGQRDKLSPVSDQPLCSELIRFCSQFCLNSGTLLSTAEQPKAQMLSVFFSLSIPTIGVGHTGNIDLLKWKKLKADSKAMRDEYHQWMNNALSNVALYLEQGKDIPQLMTQLRDELNITISKWSPMFKSAGLWLTPWLLTALYQYSAAPAQLESILAATGIIVTGKLAYDLVHPSQPAGPLAYELTVNNNAIR